MVLYLYLLILLILYIILINHFIKDKKYKNKILIALSISILFSYLYQSIRNNEGYAVTESLPKSFYVLNTYVYGDDILILIREKNNSPRLYKLQKSLKLNKFLKKYEGLRMDQVITYKGTLKLNVDDIYQLNYILEDAEIIE